MQVEGIEHLPSVLIPRHGMLLNADLGSEPRMHGRDNGTARLFPAACVLPQTTLMPLCICLSPPRVTSDLNYHRPNPSCRGCMKLTFRRLPFADRACLSTPDHRRSCVDPSSGPRAHFPSSPKHTDAFLFLTYTIEDFRRIHSSSNRRELSAFFRFLQSAPSPWDAPRFFRLRRRAHDLTL